MAWTEGTLPHNVTGVGLAAVSRCFLTAGVRDRGFEFFPSAAICGGEVKGFGVTAEVQGQGL